jgi:hypothetical protein
MTPLFLTTVLSCNQLVGIVQRVFQNKFLNEQQKIEIIREFKLFIPSCPLIIQINESKRKPSN